MIITTIFFFYFQSGNGRKGQKQNENPSSELYDGSNTDCMHFRIHQRQESA